MLSFSNGDAFNRLRVSEPTTLFEYNPVFDKSPHEWEEVVHGTGNCTHNTNSYLAMTVAGAGDAVIRQTYDYIDYQPGKSKLTLFTGVLNTTPAPGVVSRIGQFDDAINKTVVADGGNGHFFELDGTTLSVVQRTGYAGSLGPGNFDTRVPQVNWNLDRLDGTGPSTLVWNYASFAYLRLFVIDLQWLGIGRVRMGIYMNGVIHYLHEFINEWDTQPYTRMAKLPIRYEISSHGGAGEMRQVCSSVLIEGGTYLPLGRFSAFQTTAAVKVPHIAFRLKPAYNRISVIPTTVTFLPSGGSATEFDWTVARVPLTNVQGGIWNLTDSAVEVNVSATAVVMTPGVIIYAGLGISRTENVFDIPNKYVKPLVSRMDGTSFALVIRCSVNCAIAVGWMEIR